MLTYHLLCRDTAIPNYCVHLSFHFSSFIIHYSFLIMSHLLFMVIQDLWTRSRRDAAIPYFNVHASPPNNSWCFIFILFLVIYFYCTLFIVEYVALIIYGVLSMCMVHSLRIRSRGDAAIPCFNVDCLSLNNYYSFFFHFIVYYQLFIISYLSSIIHNSRAPLRGLWTHPCGLAPTRGNNLNGFKDF